MYLLVCEKQAKKEGFQPIFTVFASALCSIYAAYILHKSEYENFRYNGRMDIYAFVQIAQNDDFMYGILDR